MILEGAGRKKAGIAKAVTTTCQIIIRATNNDMAGRYPVTELLSIFKRRTSKQIELKALNAEHRDRTLAMSDVQWIARVLWASQ